MKRRQMLAAIAAAAAAPAALAAEASGAPKKVWPKVPEGWYGEGMYQDLAKDGTGVTAPGTEGLPTAAGTLDSEGVVGQAAAVEPGDIGTENGPQGPVGTGDGDVHRPLLPLLQSPLHLLQ